MISVLLLASAAMASSAYPGGIDADVGMPCAPQCTLCHTSNAGGAGTVTTEFGIAMMDRGLLGGSQADLLSPALTALENDAVDSDGDAIIDIDELANGDDPNGGAAYCDLLTPSYGCFNHAAGAGWSAGAVVLALLAVRRRRSA